MYGVTTAYTTKTRTSSTTPSSLHPDRDSNQNMIVSALQADTTAHSTVPADSNSISTIAIDDRKTRRNPVTETGQQREISTTYRGRLTPMKRVSVEDQFVREKTNAAVGQE